MNKRKKKLIVAGLRAGLQHLAMSLEEYLKDRTKDTYLCYAIDKAQKVGKCTSEEAKAAMAHIKGALNGWQLVEQYLGSELHIDPKLLTLENVQDYRKRWAEHMIAELS